MASGCLVLLSLVAALLKCSGAAIPDAAITAQQEAAAMANLGKLVDAVAFAASGSVSTIGSPPVMGSGPAQFGTFFKDYIVGTSTSQPGTTLRGLESTYPSCKLAPVLTAVGRILEQDDVVPIMEDLRSGLTMKQRRRILTLIEDVFVLSLGVSGPCSNDSASLVLAHLSTCGISAISPTVASFVNALVIINKQFVADQSFLQPRDVLPYISLTDSFIVGRTFLHSLDRALRSPLAFESKSERFRSSHAALSLRIGQVVGEILGILQQSRLPENSSAKAALKSVADAWSPIASSYTISWLNNSTKFGFVIAMVAATTLLVNILFIILTSH